MGLMGLKTTGRMAACLLALALALGALPAHRARAADQQRYDMSFGTPEDIDIWEDGTSLYVKHNGVQRKLTPGTDVYRMKDYLVTVETHPDADGGPVTIVYFNIVFVTDNVFFLSGSYTDADGSVYQSIGMYGSNSRYTDYNSKIYYVTIRGDEISEFTLARTLFHSASSPSGDLHDQSDYALRSERIYQAPFLQGGYKIYCSRPVHSGTSDGETLCPATPLPAASRAGDGDSDLPYKTTFRMLAGGALVYNTFYYTGCFLSGKDEVSASGKIRLDATKLSDGTVSRAMLPAPQLLCQVSSYGTAYDIVYTNDDALCALLGIDRPQGLRWDVGMQRWIPAAWDEPVGGGGDGPENPVLPWDEFVTGVVTPDNTNPFTYSDTLPAVSGLAVSPVGTDARIPYGDYRALYGNSLLHVSDDPQDGATPWGLGSSLAWTPVSNGSGHGAGLRVAARVRVQLADGTVRQHDLILHDYDGSHPGNNKSWAVSVSGGRLTVALYDLVILLQQRYGEYVSHPPAKLLDVQYALTPFYVDGGKYSRGKSAYITHAVDSAFSAVPSDPTVPGVPDPWDPIVDGTLWGSVKSLGAYIKESIADAIASVAGFLGGVLASANRILSGLGSLPAMVSELFGFLPPEFVAALGVGLSLWLLPSLLGLARSGLKALGGLCSTLFGFLSSFFGG